jgi:uncharacterized protein YqcC (DUF446 family)
MAKHSQIGRLLITLQQEMQAQGQWSTVAISSQALMSQQPFCMDTMNFSQWLQFVFIPRMQALIDGQLPLPSMAKGQGIEPMASEYYKQDNNCQPIIILIAQLDDLLTN